MFFRSLSSTKEEGSHGMRTSRSRNSTGSHGVIVTELSADMRCAFQVGCSNACSAMLFVCLERLRAQAAQAFHENATWFFGARPRAYGGARSRSVRGLLALSCVNTAFFCCLALSLAASIFALFAAKSASRLALR